MFFNCLSLRDRLVENTREPTCCIRCSGFCPGTDDLLRFVGLSPGPQEKRCKEPVYTPVARILACVGKNGIPKSFCLRMISRFLPALHLEEILKPRIDVIWFPDTKTLGPCFRFRDIHNCIRQPVGTHHLRG